MIENMIIDLIIGFCVIGIIFFTLSLICVCGIAFFTDTDPHNRG